VVEASVLATENRGKPLAARWRAPLRIAAVIAVVVLLLLVGRAAGALLPSFSVKVAHLGPWGPVAFMVIYALAAVAFVPGSLLTLAAGAIFGVVWGAAYTLVGATAGAALAFLIARHAARSAVERRLAGNRRFVALDRAIGAEGRKIVFLLRLSPVFPFTLMNYALGLTRVRLPDYLAASVGMIPGTLMYVYYGKVIGDVAAVAGGVRMQRGPADWALLALGLAATIAVTTVVTGAARRALKEQTELADGAAKEQ
jgi:uncharacterized membrane protein YdjX (TVP38/TMEM64 family)